VHRGLNGDGADSVHLADWPDVSGLPKDDALVNAMDLARDVCSSALSVRKAHSRRVRLPLSSLTVAAPTASDLERFADILRDEVNVRNVVLTADVAAVASHELQVVPAVLGPRLGGRTQQIIKAVKAGEWTQSGDVIEVAGETLQPGEFTLKLVTSADTASATLPGGVGVVLLDVNVTPELEAEGMARDLIRAVQQARRDAGLDVSDRIVLTLGADSSVRTQVEPHIPMVSEETLAVQVTWDDSADRSVEIEGAHVHVSVTAVR
jgi:isoleucyl-tRNA synthetase